VFSDIAGRYTNLLHTPNLQAPRLVADVPGGLKGSQRGFLEERLIHRTFRGEMVSSKNELIIANILFDLEKPGHLKYQVEPRLRSTTDEDAGPLGRLSYRSKRQELVLGALWSAG
jgi:hypothetical protein